MVGHILLNSQFTRPLQPLTGSNCFPRRLSKPCRALRTTSMSVHPSQEAPRVIPQLLQREKRQSYCREEVSAKDLQRQRTPALTQMPALHQPNGQAKRTLRVPPALAAAREQHCEGPVKTQHSERWNWHKRRLSPDTPLTIVNFEGVLGDFFKPVVWEQTPKTLYLRPDWAKGLKALLAETYVVLFAGLSSKKLARLLLLCKLHGVEFDAVYRNRGLRSSQDYAQLLTDFQVTTATVLVSVGLEQSALKEREAIDLVRDSSLSKGRQLLGLGLPRNPGLTMVLVPNPRAQERLLAVPFDCVASLANKATKQQLTAVQRTAKTDWVPCLSVTGEQTGGELQCVVVCGEFLPRKKYVAMTVAEPLGFNMLRTR